MSSIWGVCWQERKTWLLPDMRRTTTKKARAWLENRGGENETLFNTVKKPQTDDVTESTHGVGGRSSEFLGQFSN